MARLQLANAIAAFEVLGIRQWKFDICADRQTPTTQTFTHHKHRVWTHRGGLWLCLWQFDAINEHFIGQQSHQNDWSECIC